MSLGRGYRIRKVAEPIAIGVDHRRSALRDKQQARIAANARLSLSKQTAAGEVSGHRSQRHCAQEASAVHWRETNGPAAARKPVQIGRTQTEPDGLARSVTRMVVRFAREATPIVAIDVPAAGDLGHAKQPGSTSRCWFGT